MDYITERKQQLIDEMSRRAEMYCAALHEVHPDQEFEYSIDCSDNRINCTVRPKVNTEPKITHIYLKCTVENPPIPADVAKWEGGGLQNRHECVRFTPSALTTRNS